MSLASTKRRRRIEERCPPSFLPYRLLRWLFFEKKEAITALKEREGRGRLRLVVHIALKD